MPAVNLSPVFLDAQLDSSGNPLAGGQLFTYAAGSTTKQTTYTSSAGSTAQANPIVLNSRGEPASPIWLTDGQTYKFVLAPSTDTDPPTSPIRTIDNVVGVNDIAATAQSEWVSQSVSGLTFVSSSTFTMTGDQTTEFHVGRRIKITDGAGTDYATISKSSFASNVTTITIDAAVLTTPVSAVSLGITSAANTSAPLPENAIINPYAPFTAFGNLVVAQASTTTATITADKVVVADTSGRKTVLSTVSLTVNKATTGANGIDDGVEVSPSWYYLYVIWNGTTVAGLLSTSATAPTMPTGYTHKGLIGAIYNSAAGDFDWMDQRNAEVIRERVAALTTGTATGYTSVSLSAIVPAQARAVAGYARLQDSASALSRGWIAASDNAADRGAVIIQNPGGNANNLDAYFRVRLLTNQTIYYKIDAANDDLDIFVSAWEY